MQHSEAHPVEVREDTAYTPIMRTIHWATAALFIAAMLIGLYCGLQPPGTSPRRELLEVHKSLGMTLLFLSVLRLVVRVSSVVPPEPGQVGPLMRLAARLTHLVLYVILFAMPLTGYAFSSAGGYSLKFFWTFDWPRLFAGNSAVAHAGEVSHDALAWLVYAAVGLHVAATLWHALVLRDGTLARMWPRRAERPR